MCLYTYDKKPLIAKDDIVCYKVVEYNPEMDTYNTPLQKTDVSEYVKNKTIWKDPSEPPVDRKVVGKGIYDRSLYEIGMGYIHAFREPYGNITYHVYKCIVPKGTEYYLGFSNDICARAIQFVEEYKPEEEC